MSVPRNHIKVFLVTVVKGSRQPYSFDRKYYIREGSKSKEASIDDISRLLRTSNSEISTWEKQTTIDATLDDLDNHEIETSIDEAKKMGKGNSLPDEVPAFLNYFQLTDMNLIRNGCMVLFGKNPVRFISQCRIRITVMPFGKTGSRFDDTVLIDDNLLTAFNRIQEYFIRNLSLISEFRNDDWNRSSREKYPMEALDEAILNAMIHRDYADISGEVTINIYSDKIVIINSGEIPEGIVLKKNIISEHHSVLRNPTIAQIFYLRGKIEMIGRGLVLIKKLFNEFGLREPEWESRLGYTTLTLFGVPKSLNINERMLRYLKTLRVGFEFSREDYEEFHNRCISEKTARNDISKMDVGKFVTKISVGPSTIYRRTNKELPDVAGNI